MSGDRDLWIIRTVPESSAPPEWDERLQREGFTIEIHGGLESGEEYLRRMQEVVGSIDGSFGRETWWAMTDAPWWRRAWDRATDPVRAAWWRLRDR